MSILGIGIDLVDIERVRGVVERRGAPFLARVFTPDEIAYCERHKDPAPSLSARFGAKEALIKALGVGWKPGMKWTDIEVQREKGGRPVLVLHGSTGAIAAERGVRTAHLSLTHGEREAVAYVILED
ncbi:holo-ACP synthase [bacterium]|nr:holo-ACP synthase [bacterium]